MQIYLCFDFWCNGSASRHYIDFFFIKKSLPKSYEMVMFLFLCCFIALFKNNIPYYTTCSLWGCVHNHHFTFLCVCCLCYRNGMSGVDDILELMWAERGPSLCFFSGHSVKHPRADADVGKTSGWFCSWALVTGRLGAALCLFTCFFFFFE